MTMTAVANRRTQPTLEQARDRFPGWVQLKLIFIFRSNLKPTHHEKTSIPIFGSIHTVM